MIVAFLNTEDKKHGLLIILRYINNMLDFRTEKTRLLNLFEMFDLKH